MKPPPERCVTRQETAAIETSLEKYILVPIMRKGLWGLTCDQAQLYHRSYVFFCRRSQPTKRKYSLIAGYGDGREWEKSGPNY